ncbi:uncharacterized protein BDR25DRAFT_356679 [Lindgomyces ingoldianus]|uniref:Uncharacterized protein n=1 Tax=Lindgomyces ingoldianus TaxID=673940 RepID=A0ACB6QT26_9PLEO|nr:uncharacterized protein BDR25DRAFT_356679 [Lindgomyces ingoldianus]KAF2469452.1 hypothetical protein BDR25DRAFT_356679 [Lindgomyces ingoldianus]
MSIRKLLTLSIRKLRQHAGKSQIKRLTQICRDQPQVDVRSILYETSKPMASCSSKTASRTEGNPSSPQKRNMISDLNTGTSSPYCALLRNTARHSWKSRSFVEVARPVSVRHTHLPYDYATAGTRNMGYVRLHRLAAILLNSPPTSSIAKLVAFSSLLHIFRFRYYLQPITSCPSPGTMCRFTWNRWSCGHFNKTRIEYCDVSALFTPDDRDELPCHTPDDSPDYNNHFPEWCFGCTLGHPPAETRLHYIELHPLECEHRLTASEDEYTRAFQATQLARREYDNLCEAAATGVRECINSLARDLSQFEDQYRALGGQYYRQGWFAHRDAILRHDAFNRLIDAFHGNIPIPHRRFFRGWLDLEISIRAALDALEDRSKIREIRVQTSRKECQVATTFVRNINESLNQLKCDISHFEFVEEANRQFRLDGRPTTRDRNAALWYWLKCLPETHLALQAGKRRYLIIQDALGCSDEGFVNTLPLCTPTGRWTHRQSEEHLDIETPTTASSHNRQREERPEIDIPIMTSSYRRQVNRRYRRSYDGGGSQCSNEQDWVDEIHTPRDDSEPVTFSVRRRLLELDFMETMGLLYSLRLKLKVIFFLNQWFLGSQFPYIFSVCLNNTHMGNSRAFGFLGALLLGSSHSVLRVPLFLSKNQAIHNKSRDYCIYTHSKTYSKLWFLPITTIQKTLLICHNSKWKYLEKPSRS